MCILHSPLGWPYLKRTWTFSLNGTVPHDLVLTSELNITALVNFFFPLLTINVSA